VLSHERSAFGPRQAESFATYLQFLEHNDLEHVVQPGKANRAYDAALAAAQLQQNFLANCRGRVGQPLRINPSPAGVGR
jgi:hypothetical protein